MKIGLKYLLFVSGFIICWLSKTTAQTVYPSSLTVAQDGSGNYKTISEAIAAFRAYSPVPLQLTIKNGVYHEKIVIPSWLTGLTITGESRDKTIISYDDYSGKPLPNVTDTAKGKNRFSTFTSYTVLVQGNDIQIKNLTIRNAAGRVGQAVALHVDGDRFILQNCDLLGNQDTLLTANDTSRQFYDNCYIEGTTDFIFGAATAVFQDCTIKNLINSYITAASTTQKQAYGYVFFRCKLIAAEVAKLVYLGRPWRQFAKVVYIGCEMGSHIRPEGWENWGKPENEKTAYYAEYKNTGPGAVADKRVGWSHQLTKKEAQQYTLEHIFSGTVNWNPLKPDIYKN